MAYRGKPSKNCADCRRRKIKCDLKVPGCTQCSNAGLECSGYRNQLDLMFLDENERTAKSVMKRSKSSSRKTPSDTSSAPSRRSSPTLTTIADTPVTSRNASLPSIPRRSPSIGPPRATRASERRKSRTTTPEEGGTRSRAASKAALRRTASAQQTYNGDFLQPIQCPNASLRQQQPQQHQPLQAHQIPSNTDFDFGGGYDLGFDIGSTSNIGTPYSQGSSNASVPSINIPLHFENMTLSQPTNFTLPSSVPQMSFSMPPAAPLHNYYQHVPSQHPPQRAITFPPNTGYEQQWDCGQWVHDVQPLQHTGMLTAQIPLPSDEEWLQWQWSEDQQHHQHQ